MKDKMLFLLMRNADSNDNHQLLFGQEYSIKKKKRIIKFDYILTVRL
jgi:hypothetical protein